MRIRPIRFKPIKIHYNLDLDRDGVSDFRDCQPFNPFRQEEELIPEIKEAYRKVKGKLSKKTQEKLEPIEEAVGPYVEEAEGLEDTFKEKLKGAKEKVKEKYEDTTFAKERKYKKALEGEESFKNLPTYLLVKIKGDKWYNWGEVPAESITLAQIRLKEITRHPNIESAKLSKDPLELKKLNLGVTKQKLGKAVSEYGKKHGFTQEELTKKLKKGMEVKPEGRAAMTRYAQGPGSRPPRREFLQPRLPSQQRMGYPEMDMEYQRPREQYGYSQRSPFYQEQSVFGEKVVPYRPIGRMQVTSPYKSVSFPMTPSSRPKGMVVGAHLRPLSFKPVSFNFLKIGYRRRM